MYRNLQQQAKEYIVGSLSKLSDEWWFDIDTYNKDNPIIMGYGPENSMIEGPIEELDHYVTEESTDKIWDLDKMWDLYKIPSHGATKWLGCWLIKRLISDIFRIYGIYGITTHNCTHISVLTKNGRYRMQNYIYANTYPDNDYMYIVSPFNGADFERYISKEKLVSSLLLLLDPIEYFRQYSIIIKKYPQLQHSNILETYMVLLEYFPEMNEELFEKYLPLQRIF